MNKPPAFQFYTKDFMSSTMGFSAEEVGAYIRLLAWSWDNGALPKSDEQITRIAGVDLAVWRAISHKWIASETGWTNARLELTRRKQLAFRKLQAQHGRKRWQRVASAEPVPNPRVAPAELMPSDLHLRSTISDLQKDQERTARTRTPAAPVRDPSGRALAEGGAWGQTAHHALALALPTHLRCFHAPEVCARGWCIPPTLGARWVAQQSEATVAGFVRDVLAAVPPGAIGDAWKFWGDQWERAHAPPGPTAARTRAIGPGYAGWVCPHTPACEQRHWCALKSAKDGET